MSKIERFLLFILLQIIALAMYPLDVFGVNVTPANPETGATMAEILTAIQEMFVSGPAFFILIILVVGAMVGLGVLLYRGNLGALTFTIFVQGLNVIVRMMMFFPRAVGKKGEVDSIFIITMLIGLLLSLWLLFRLDRQDIRVNMR